MMTSVMRVMAPLRWAPLLQAITSLLYVGVGLWTARPLDRWSLISALLAFLIAWPIAEWWMHRVLFHRWFRRDHWHHHADPQGDLSVMPPIVELAFAGLFGALVMVMGARIGASVFSGFVLGYSVYNDVHWCMHVGWWPTGGCLGKAVRRHTLHHRGVEANYNVLLPIGDLLFGTYRYVPPPAPLSTASGVPDE